MHKKRTFLVLLAALLALPIGARAQDAITIGDGTTTDYHPLPGWYGWQYEVYIYTPTDAEELDQSISISSIGFDNTTSTSSTGAQLEIWLKDVDANYTLANATTFADFTNNATLVYSNTTFSSTTGWNTLQLSEEFIHEGGNALLVIVRDVGCSTSGSCARSCRYTTTTGAHWFKRQDSSDPGTSASGTVDGKRANIQIAYDDANPNACRKVKGLGANPTTDEVVLTWTDTLNSGATYTVQQISGTDTTELATGLSDMTYTATGLSANTAYTFRVKATCSDESESNWATVNVRTDCGAISALPWTDGFEDYTINQMPVCYTHLTPSASSSNNDLFVYGSAVHNGSKCLRFNYSQPSGNMVALPAFEAEIRTLEISFWHRPESVTTNSGTLQIGYLTDADDASSFVPVEQWAYNDFTSATYRQETVLFVGAPDGARIAFRHTSSTNNWYWHLDDIDVHEAPDCTHPVVSLSNLTSTGVTVNLADANDLNNYILIVGNESIEVNGTSYELTDLAPTTTYTISAATVCSDGNNTDTVTLTFATPCTAIAELPWTENFDSDSNMYTGYVVRMNGGMFPCWDYVGNPQGYAFLTENSYRYGSEGYSFGSYPGAVAQLLYVLPAFEADLSTLEFTMATRPEGTSSSSGSMDIGYITNATDPASFVSVEHLDYSDFNGEYMTVATTFANAPAGARIALRHNAASSNWYWFFDDLEVHVAPECMRPDSISAMGTGTTTAHLTISDPTTVNNYQVQIIHGSDTLNLTVNDTAYDITDLDPGTYYTVNVRTNCSDGSVTAARSTTFLTECAVISSLPWHEDFNTFGSLYTSYVTRMREPMIPCWGFIGHNNDAFMFLTNNSYLYGTSGYSFAFYPGTSNVSNYAVLPEFSDAISTLEFSCVMRPEGTSSSSGSLDIGYLTDATDASTFVAVDHYDYSDFSDSYMSVNAIFTGAPDGSRIALRHNSSASNYYWFIDEVDVHEAPSCPRPQAVAVSDIETTSATMHIADSNANMNYRYVLSHIADGVPVYDTLTTTDTVVDLSGLEHSTTYLVSVVGLCDDGTVTSAVSTTFFTACDAESFPFHFTAADMMAVQSPGFSPCWSYTSNVYRSYSNGVGYVYSSTTGAHFDLPAVDIDFTDAQFRTMAATTASTNSFSVGVMDGSNNITWLDTIQMEQTPNSYTGVEYVVPLTGYVGTGNRVVVGFLTSSSVYFHEFHVENLDVCPKVSNLGLASVTDNEAVVEWTSNGEETTWLVYVGNQEPVEVSENPYTLSGLSAVTTYTVGVRALCGDGDTSRASTITFATSCAAIDSIPWTENFDNMNTSYNATDITCWDHIGVGYLNIENGHAYQGNSLRFYPNNSSAPNIAILPPFGIDIEGLELTMQTRPEGSSSGSISVGYITNPSDSTTFVALSTYAVADFPSTSSYMQVEQTFAGAPAGARIALRHNVNSTSWYWFIDELDVHAAPTCLRPSGLTASNILESSATLSWQAAAGQSQWIVYLNGVEVGVANDTTYVLSGLSASTNYTVGVRAFCGGTDTSTMTTASFMTPCGAASLPYSENFNNWGTTFSQCWSRATGVPYSDNAAIAATATYGWGVNTSYGSHISIDGSALTVNIYSDNVHYWTISPDIEMSADSATLSFDVAVARWSDSVPTFDADDRFVVAVTTDGGTTFTPIYQAGADSTRDDASLLSFGNAYTTVTVPVNGYNGQSIRLVFYGGSVTSNNADNRLVVDNISLVAGGSQPGPGPQPQPCNAPTITNATSTDNSVTLTWTSTESNFEVAIVEGAWSEPASGTAVSGTQHTFSDLSAGTQYTAGVRTVCADGQYSVWVTRSVATQNGGDEGIASADGMAFSLYPNPASSVVTVDASEAVSLAVIDQSGRMVYTSKVEATKHTVDVSQMAKGAYYVRLTGQSGTAVRKLVVK